MAREITEDLKLLKDFINDYSLKKHINNKDYIATLSVLHKKYFSFLTCIGELNHLRTDGSLQPYINENQIDYLTESCSDIGNAIFVLLHGAYKPSRLMVRSSIETFLKGFTLDEYPDILTEKSLYKIFDNIKLLSFFQNDKSKQIFQDIHQLYGVLCEDTHTASTVNMKQITALTYFPEFEKEEAENISKIILKLVISYVTLICLKYNSHYLKMHHKNKENVLHSVEKEMRPFINGIRT